VVFKQKVEEVFPKLSDCGGWELLRSGITSRTKLDPIVRPPGGFSSENLSDNSLLGQAVCFIRPIQKDLSLLEATSEVFHVKSITQGSCHF